MSFPQSRAAARGVRVSLFLAITTVLAGHSPIADAQAKPRFLKRYSAHAPKARVSGR